jgi:hypothetical protein
VTGPTFSWKQLSSGNLSLTAPDSIAALVPQSIAFLLYMAGLAVFVGVLVWAGRAMGLTGWPAALLVGLPVATLIGLLGLIGFRSFRSSKE